MQELIMVSWIQTNLVSLSPEDINGIKVTHN